MKTHFYLAAILLLATTACKKADNSVPDEKPTGLTYQWTIKIGLSY